MAPIPVGPLFFYSQFNKWVVLAVSFAQVYAIGAVFVVIPVVIVPVVAVIDSVVVVVAMFFLTSVVLRLACCIHCRWRSESYS